MQDSAVIKPTDKPHYENVPFEIPVSWEWVQLKDVCTRFSTGPFGSMLHKSDYSSKGIPVVNPANIVNGLITTNKIMFVKNDKALELSKYNLAQDDIILARRGDLSKCAIVTSKNVGWLCGTGSFVMHLCLIESYYFQYIYATQYMQNILSTASVGATMDNLNQDTFSNILIPVPPLLEQKRIINGIQKWYNLIDDIDENRKELYNLIEETKRKVISQAIHGKLVPQDPNDEPAIELLKRINPSFKPCDTSHYENLPQGWFASSLKEAGIEILNGYAFQSKNYVPNGIKVIRITNVQDGYIVDDDPKYYPTSTESEIERYMLHEDDLLMSLTGNVGRVGFLPKKMLPAALNQRVGCVRGSEQVISKRYLYYFLQTDLFKRDCLDSAKGVAQLNISTEWLKSYKIPIPPKAEQTRITDNIEKIFSAIDTITAEL